MVDSRNSEGLVDPLVFDRGFEHHSLGQLVHHPTLDFLPRGLAPRVGVPALFRQGPAACGQFLVGDQEVHISVAKVDPVLVASP